MVLTLGGDFQLLTGGNCTTTGMDAATTCFGAGNQITIEDFVTATTQPYAQFLISVDNIRGPYYNILSGTITVTIFDAFFNVVGTGVGTFTV